MSTFVDLPDPVRAAVAGYAASPVDEGESGGAVLRLTAADRPTLFLKSGTGRVAHAITAEMARLEWMAGRLPVPALRLFVRSHRDAHLLTTAVPWQNAYDYLVDNPGRQTHTVDAIARFLSRVHALPIVECPFHAGHLLRLADARRNIDDDLVATDDFDDDHSGWTPEPVWIEMVTSLPPSFERVVTHGDFSLGNIMIEDDVVSGCIDVGRAGVADPYQDLAILSHNLEEFGAALQQAMWRAYGIAEPDERRIRFHRRLDEFF